jgi:hypothetical protein
VSEEVGLETEEGEGEEAGADVKHFARGEEDEEGGSEGEEEGREACAEDEGFGGVMVAVGGTVVEEELAAVEVGLGFEEAVLEGWDVEMEGEKGEGGEEFDEGRVLGIKAEVVGLPGFIAGEDVVVFVPSEGLAVDGVEDLRGEEEEEKDDRGGDVAVGAGGWCGGGERHRVAVMICQGRGWRHGRFGKPVVTR